MKNKKWLLLLIIALPSSFWVLLELSTINSKKLPHFGPKQIIAKGDTVYYSVGKTSFYSKNGSQLVMKEYDTVNYPVLVLSFIKQQYVKDGFRVGGLLDYTLYKKDDIEKIPTLLVYPKNPANNDVPFDVKDSLRIPLKNIEQCYWPANSFDSINFKYFKEKPVYIDYSFFLLLDKKRNIRGYYDGRYEAEIKRMLGEYRHIRLKEGKAALLKENEIKHGENK
jgi:hypothetical protein